MLFEYRAEDRSVGKATLPGKGFLSMLAGISFGDHPNRFLLHFKAVGIDDQPISTNTLPILVWNSGNTLHLSNPEHLTGRVTVISLMGQSLIQMHLTADPDQTILHALREGIYVVQVQADSKSLSRKIVVTE